MTPNGYTKEFSMMYKPNRNWNFHGKLITRSITAREP
jgi:hypothetical protein